MRPRVLVVSQAQDSFRHLLPLLHALEARGWRVEIARTAPASASAPPFEIALEAAETSGPAILAYSRAQAPDVILFDDSDALLEEVSRALNAADRTPLVLAHSRDAAAASHSAHLKLCTDIARIACASPEHWRAMIPLGGDGSALAALVEAVTLAQPGAQSIVDHIWSDADSLNLLVAAGHPFAAQAKEAYETTRALIGRLAVTSRNLQRAKDAAHALETSASLRIGAALLKALRDPKKLLALPRDLLVIAREIKSERRTAIAAPVWRLRKMSSEARGDALDITPRKAAEYVRADVRAGQSYRIVGHVTSLPGRACEDVVLEAYFCDAKGKPIAFAHPAFTFSARTKSNYALLRSGVRQRLEATLTAPSSARLLVLGVSRRVEGLPLLVELAPVREVEGDVDITSFKGLAPIPIDQIDRAALTPREAAFDADKEAGVRIVSILDTFSAECFAPIVKLDPLSRTDWAKQIRRGDTSALLAESAWRGNDGAWNFVMSQPDKHGADLDAAVRKARAENVPSVFWNKEDPAGFDTFIETAKKFDHIFTTDAGSVARYRALCGHDRVDAMLFAAQPALHHPIRATPLLQRFAFTGSWRGVKYPERARWLDAALTPLLAHNQLDIFDRFAGKSDDADLVFPEKFQSAVRGALEYRELIANVYKRYRALVNVNSVGNSETMLARRVFEILACGAPVISSPSPAMEAVFGDVVFTARSGAEVSEIAHALRTDPLLRERKATQGVRLVHSNHTYMHRLEQIGAAIGARLYTRPNKSLTLICCSKRPHFLRHVAAQMRQQTHQDFSFVFVMHGDAFDEADVADALADFPGLRVLRNPADKTLADGLNLALDATDTAYCAKIDDDDYYGPNYLKDSLLAFDYAPDAGLVGKNSFFAYLQGGDRTILRYEGQHYRYANLVQGGTFVWNREKTHDLRFTPVARGTDTLFVKDCVDSDVSVYSSDPFNFVHVRYADASDHTWRIDDDAFAKDAKTIARGLALDQVYC